MTTLAGKHILVLEDEYLLAMEVVDALEQLGAVVVGPAHRIDVALGLLDGNRMDAALLDVNIGGLPSTPVAERLQDLGIPIVYATGYGVQADVAPGSAIIDKPYTLEQMSAALFTAINGH
jgi:DNA-binding response OmpR family regulator